MTDRGPSSAEGATVCPFVAFEDDRDARADRPDHRHRCFAEVRPAPRALAHQEAYCLSGSFPACPTFQDWAHREAAKARRVAAASEPYRSDPYRDEAPAERHALRPPDRGWVSPAGAVPGEVDDPPQRSRGGRDWKQPPPWSAGTAAGAAGAAGVGRPVSDAAEDEVETPAFLARRTRLEEVRPDTGSAEEADDDDYAPRRERLRGRSLDRRPRVGASRAHRSDVDPDAPAWERPRRYEAYPTLRTRVGLPNLPRIGVALVAVLIAAAALFFLPPLFLGLDDGGSDGGGAGASGAPSPSPSASPEPTVVPSPTPQLYVIRKGDTLSKIATRFGVTIEDLLAANKEAIKNPDRISEGQEIVIPAPPGAGTESPAGAASPSP